MDELCILRADAGNRKSDQRPFLKLTCLMKDSDGAYDVAVLWARPELGQSVRATPGVYRGTFKQTVRMGRPEAELVAVELVSEGFPAA